MYVKDLNKFWNIRFYIRIVIGVVISLYITSDLYAQLRMIKVDDARASKLLLYEGVEEAVEGYWERAALKFKKAVENNSQNYIAYYCQIIVLDILDEKIPAGLGTDLFKGIDAWIFSSQPKAKNIFEKLGSGQNDYALYYLFKALNEEYLEMYEEAFNDYNYALQLDPELAFVYVKRGRLFAQKGKYEDALTDFNQAIKLDSIYYEPYYEKGVIYQELHEYTKSIRNYEKAYFLYPALKQTLHESIKICEGYNNLGLENMANGRYPEALTNFNDAINWNPNFHEPYLNRGITFRNLNLPKAAISDFYKVLEFDTVHVDVYFNLALVYQRLDSLEKTLNYLHKIKDLQPNNIQTYQLLGEIYYEQRQFEMAIRMFENVLALDENNYWGYYWVALAYDARRKYPEAIESYEIFIKVAPEEYYDQKIKMYERAERLKRWIEKKKQ
jgi:tetratricopeptide (TPR) repeat protein